MKKKIFAGLLALCMVISMLPLTAFAGDAAVIPDANVEITISPYTIGTEATLTSLVSVKWTSAGGEAYSSATAGEPVENANATVKIDQAYGTTLPTEAGSYDVKITIAAKSDEYLETVITKTGGLTVNAASTTTPDGPGQEEDTNVQLVAGTNNANFTGIPATIAALTYTGEAQTVANLEPTFKQEVTRPSTAEGAAEGATVKVEVTQTVTVKYAAATSVQTGELVLTENVTNVGTYDIYAVVGDKEVEAGENYAAFNCKGFSQRIGSVAVNKASNTLGFTMELANGVITMGTPVTITITDTAPVAANVKYNVTSSNTKVFTATNQEGGKTITVTPKGVGTATITVTSQANDSVADATKSTSAIEVVKAPKVDLTVGEGADADNAIIITVGEVKALPTPTEATSQIDDPPAATYTTFTYKSSNDKVLTVDSKGKVTGVAEGPAKVTITGTSDEVADSSVDVFYDVKKVDPATIKIASTTPESTDFAGKTATVRFDGTLTGFTASATFVSKKTQVETQIAAANINWESSDPNIVAVTATEGVPTFEINKPGTVTITASVASVTAGEGNDYGAASASFTVVVNPVKKSDLSNLQIVIGKAAEEIKYTGTAYDATALTSVTVKYGEDEAAPDQTLNAKYYDLKFTNNINMGTATITATLKDGYEGTLTKNFEILKGGAATLTARAVTVNPKTSNGTITIDLSDTPSLPAGASIKEVSRTSEEGNLIYKSVDKNGAKLVLSVDKNAKVEGTETDTFDVVFESKTNADSTLELTVKYTTAKIPALSKDSVTVKVQEQMNQGDEAATSCDTNADQAKELTAEQKATHKNHKCVVTGYTLGKWVDADGKTTVTITTSQSSITVASTDSAIATAELVAADEDDPATSDVNESHVRKITITGVKKGTTTVKVSGDANGDYAAFELILNVTVNEVPLVAPIKDTTTTPPDDSGSGDEPGTDEPTPPAPVEEPVEIENGVPSTVDKEAGVVQPVESDDTIVNIPAEVEGKVETTITKGEDGTVSIDVKGEDGEYIGATLPIEDKETGVSMDVPATGTIEYNISKDEDGTVTTDVKVNGEYTGAPVTVKDEETGVTANVPATGEVKSNISKDKETGTVTTDITVGGEYTGAPVTIEDKDSGVTTNVPATGKIESNISKAEDGTVTADVKVGGEYTGEPVTIADTKAGVAVDVPATGKVEANISKDEATGKMTADVKVDGEYTGETVTIADTEEGVAVNVPATGKVEASVTKEDVEGEDSTVIGVNVTVDGETPEIDVPTAVKIPEEEIADIEDKDMVVAYIVNEDGTKTLLPKSGMNEDGILSAHIPNGSKVVFAPAESNLKGLDETYEAAAKAMSYLSARGVMNGKDDNAAEPKATTNRYELVMMLHNLERNAEKGEIGDFADVQDGHWASNSVAWAFEMGIAKGDGTNFNGENEMTRQELAVFLYRYAQKYAPNTMGKADKSEYVDSDKLSGWAEEAMRWAVGNGIINGDGNGSVMPQATATREQVAMMLTRLLKQI